MVFKNSVLGIILLLALIFLCPLADSLGQEARDFNSIAVSMTENGSYDDALIYYNKALEAEPAYIQALDNKGSTLYLMGDYSEASKVFDHILSIYPDSAAGPFQKGYGSFQSGSK